MPQDVRGFHKLSKLGEGAYSTIYLAREEGSSRLVALKQVCIESPEQKKYLEHLSAEHDIAQTFDHEVLRKTYKLVRNRKWLQISSAVLVMEYVQGAPLTQAVRSHEHIHLLRVFRQVARGLDAMHQKKFIHADLKPENILVGPKERVKIIDYGQSFPMGQSKQRIQGTVDYMAPEQVRREMLDRRTDVFGLGAVMHRVFTGQPVMTMMNKKLGQHTMAQVGKRVATCDPLESADLPPLLAKLILYCCHTEREYRPPDMKAVIRLIDLSIIKIDAQGSDNLRKNPILLVEDDAVDIMAVHRLLKTHEVANPLELARDGEQALAYLQDDSLPRPGLILLDLRMPRMNGIEFLKRIKNEPDWEDIPVVVMSTLSDDKYKDASLDLGAHGYVEKSNLPDMLLDTLKSLDLHWRLDFSKPSASSPHPGGQKHSLTQIRP